MYRTYCILRDSALREYHGKGPADGAGNDPIRMINQMAAANTPIPPGARTLTLALAIRHKDACRASQSSTLKPRWGAVFDYLIAHVPKDGFDESITDAKNGYKGSSLDYFFQPTRNGILTRVRLCSCDRCIRKLYSRCVAKELTQIIRLRSVTKSSVSPNMTGASSGAGSESLQSYIHSVGVGEFVATRIHKDDERLDGDDFCCCEGCISSPAIDTTRNTSGKYIRSRLVGL